MSRLATRDTASAPLFGNLLQTTVTFIAVIIAGIAAYVVFLHERTVQFDERITQQRVEIREALNRLRGEWYLQWPYLPFEFAEVYHSYYPNKTRADLTHQAAVDLLFGFEPLKSALADVHADKAPSGRAYYWILTESVARLTPGLVQEMPDETSDAFPANATGSGFEEWRRDFMKINGVATLLQMQHSSYVSDFESFVPGTTGNAPVIRAHVRNAEQMFYQRLATIRISVSEIDKHILLKKPYELNARLHWRVLLALGAAAFVSGGIVPLLILAIQPSWQGPIGVSATVVTLLLIVSAVIIFGFDIVSPVQLAAADYLRAHWYAPLGYRLKDHEQRLANSEMLDTAPLWDALNSAERAQFPPAFTTRLTEYTEVARRYNSAAAKLMTRVISAVRADTSIAGLIDLGSPPSGPGIGLNPVDLFNPNLRDRIKTFLTANPTGQISIEAPMPTWRKVEVRFRTRLSENELARLVSGFAKIGNDVNGTQLYQDFQRNLEDARKSVVALRVVLHPLLMSAADGSSTSIMSGSIQSALQNPVLWTTGLTALAALAAFLYNVWQDHRHARIRIEPLRWGHAFPVDHERKKSRIVFTVKVTAHNPGKTPNRLVSFAAWRDGESVNYLPPLEEGQTDISAGGTVTRDFQIVALDTEEPVKEAQARITSIRVEVRAIRGRQYRALPRASFPSP